MSKFMNAACAALMLAIALPAAAQVDVAPFIKDDTFTSIELSPTGEFYAATVPLGDRTGLVVLKRADNTVTARFALGKDTHIYSFTWVNDRRLLISMAEAFGSNDQPSPTGELFGVDADGRNVKMLVGARVEGSGSATRLQAAEVELVYASLIDDLPDEENFVLVAVSPFHADPYTRVERMDVRTGRRVQITRASVPHADFTTDNAQEVRFAEGVGKDNASMLFHRANKEAEWTLVNDQSKSGRVESPVGFAADNRIAYLIVTEAKGPDSVVAFDTATGERKPLLRHETVDPYLMLRGVGKDGVIVGAQYSADKPDFRYFDPESPDARLYRMLQGAFPGHAAYITSSTSDGKLALVQVESATNPGDFYLFDVVAKKAEHLLSRRDWFDPAQLGTVKPVTLKARDGQVLHGFLTLPPGSSGKKLPMVLNPHGGPFGVFDELEFNDEVQLLAKAGYAVLQVNFRGSGNYGRAFKEAGARQWGGTMQDDLTDATRWAISEGIADPGRICIYGASYGAYAAMMGAAREPALYRCAVGYVGVYDLDKMVRDSSGDSQYMSNFDRQWVGERGKLGAVSPNRLADRIKAPVFLAAGGEDRIAPIEHTKMMEQALRKASVPVETLYYPNESHGFYTDEHRREYYTRLLDFLARHIGGAKAAAGEGKAP